MATDHRDWHCGEGNRTPELGPERLTGVLTCPGCGSSAHAEIPSGACLYFWSCPGCGSVLAPRPGDCCVFCSYGDRRCPTAVAPTKDV